MDIGMTSRAVMYRGKEIEAFIWRDKTFCAYVGVHVVEDGSVKTLSLSDPLDPTCNVATRIDGGLNADIVSQLHASVGHHSTHVPLLSPVVTNIQSYLAMLTRRCGMPGCPPGEN